MKRLSYFVMFVAVVTLFASCAKTEMAEPKSSAKQTVSEAFDLLVNNADKAGITKNFVEPETGITGTLYKVKSSDGTVQEILYTETEPTLLTGGSKLFHTGTFMIGVGNMEGMYTCGPVRNNCLTLGSITIIW